MLEYTYTGHALGIWICGCRELWASKSMGANSTKRLKICRCKKGDVPNIYGTVTDLANSCVTPLFRCPQGCQGCLEKQNHPLSWNLVVWCPKIWPKTKKVQKTSELTKQMSKMMVFLCFFKVYWFLAQF